MCETLPLKRIKRSSFRFKKYEFGYRATVHGFTIHVGRNGDTWWWDVEKGNNEIAQCDFVYKSDAASYNQAIKRAVRALHKWRIDHD